LIIIVFARIDGLLNRFKGRRYPSVRWWPVGDNALPQRHHSLSLVLGAAVGTIGIDWIDGTLCNTGWRVRTTEASLETHGPCVSVCLRACGVPRSLATTPIPKHTAVGWWACPFAMFLNVSCNLELLLRTDWLQAERIRIASFLSTTRYRHEVKAQQLQQV